MNFRKTFIELVFTFFISYFIYGLIDISAFRIYEWDQDMMVNLIHTWLTLFSSYFIFNTCLKLAFIRWKNISIKKLILLLFAISLIVLIWIISTEFLFYKGYYQINNFYEETTFFDFDLPITIVLLTIGSLFFYQKYYVQPLIEEKDKTYQNTERLTVTKSKKQIFIEYKDIGLVYIENELVRIQTINGEKYHTDYTISSILNKLNTTLFYRLNRQVIVSRTSIKEFEKLEFQKLQVWLIDAIHYNKPIIVSKYNAPAFKKWLTNSP